MSRGNNPVETATEKVIADAHLSFGRTLAGARDQGSLLATTPQVDEMPGIIVGRRYRPIHQKLLQHLEEMSTVTSLLRDNNRETARFWSRRSFPLTGWRGTPWLAYRLSAWSSDLSTVAVDQHDPRSIGGDG